MADSKSGDSAAQRPNDGDPADNEQPRAAEPNQPSRIETPTGEAKPKETRWASLSLWKKTSIFAVAGWVVIYGATSLLMWSVAPATWDEGRLRAIGLLLAAMIAVPGGYIAFRRQVELERSNTRDQDRLDFERERESKRQDERSEDQRREARRDLGDRFVTATKLLGDEKAAVRLAGVTALAGVADDWGDLDDLKYRDQQQACIDILCDYLRQPLPMIKKDADGAAPQEHPESPKAQDDERTPGSPRADLIPAPEEVQVRSAITRTIAKHLRGLRNPGDKKAKPGQWSALNFDFSSVTFAWPLDVRGVVFDGDADWNGATFNGNADWTGATFNSYADWNDATFNRNAYWNDATFDGNVYCSNATFGGDADWHGATFGGDAHWRDATFDGWADWSRATFDGNTDWSGASFNKKLSFRESWTGKAASFCFPPKFSRSSLAYDQEFLADVESMVMPPEDNPADDGSDRDDSEPGE